MKKIKRIRDKIVLHPIMSFLILILTTIIISGILSLFDITVTYNVVNTKTNTLEPNMVAVENLFSLRGIKYIFSNTVSNFASFTPLSMLLITLLGIGIMDKTGFLDTLFYVLTRKLRKNVVTFIIVLTCILSSIGGDLFYIVLIPISALIFKYGKRNPQAGIITAFAAISCGIGINFVINSIDSSLLTYTTSAANLLKEGSSVPFTIYKMDENGNYIVDKTYSDIGGFGNKNRNKIKTIIEKNEYLKNKLNNYYFNTLSGQMSEEGQQIRIEVFLEMLKMAKTKDEIANLLKKNSQVPFTTYKTDENGEYVIDNTYRTLNDYWNANKSRIKPLIEQDNELRNKLDNYYFNTLSGQTSDDGRQRRIEVFLEMLEMAETNEEIANMLKFNSQVPFTTYKIDENGKKVIDKEYDSIGVFWNNKPRRKKIYRIVKNNLEKYSKVHEAFDSFLLGNDTYGGESLDRKIEVFIDMLEHGNSNILINRNDEKFTTYKTDENGKDYAYKTYGNVGQFWYKTNNRKKIYSILNSNPHKYANSFETINAYLLDSNNKGVDSINRRIEVFLEMLNHGNSKILRQKNKEQYTIYSSYDEETDNNYTIKKYGTVGQFWNRDFNRKKVLKIILENPQKYENAIQTIIKYYKVKSLEEFLELERKKEELKKLKKLKKQSELVSNQIDIKNDNYRKAI